MPFEFSTCGTINLRQEKQRGTQHVWCTNTTPRVNLQSTLSSGAPAIYISSFPAAAFLGNIPRENNRCVLRCNIAWTAWVWTMDGLLTGFYVEPPRGRSTKLLVLRMKYVTSSSSYLEIISSKRYHFIHVVCFVVESYQTRNNETPPLFYTLEVHTES